MKRIISILCLALMLSCCGLFGCSSSNSVSFNKKYYVNNISFMGLSGGRADIQNYIDSGDGVEEINIFSDYLYFAMQIQIEFNNATSGKLIIPKIAAKFDTENSQAHNIITEAREAGLVNENGDFIVVFDYKKSNDSITIEKVYAKIISNDSTESMSFAEAIEKLVSFTRGENSTKDIKISNDNANILSIKKGKLHMDLFLEYRANIDNLNPDVATTLSLTWAK